MSLPNRSAHRAYPHKAFLKRKLCRGAIRGSNPGLMSLGEDGIRPLESIAANSEEAIGGEVCAISHGGEMEGARPRKSPFVRSRRFDSFARRTFFSNAVYVADSDTVGSGMRDGGGISHA